MNDDEPSVTAILQRYRGDPGAGVAVPGEPYSGAGELRGSDVLSDADLGIEDWSRLRDEGTNRPILVKRETITGLEIAGELCPEDHPAEENSERLPGTTVELGYTDGATEYIANAEIDSVRVPTDEERPLVTDGGMANAVPIQREVDASADDSDPDHIRGAKYANLLLGTDYGKGDVVQVVYLERVHPDFFEGIDPSEFNEGEQALYTAFRRDHGVVCVDDTDLLPEEFEPHDEQPPKVVDR